MKSIKNLKIHEIEKKAIASISGGLVKAGSYGSWSWGAGTYTSNGIHGFGSKCESGYTGTISYDGRVIQGICVQTESGETDTLERYAFETN